MVQAAARRDNARTHYARALAAREGSTREEIDDRAADVQVAAAEYATQILSARAALAAVGVKQVALAMARQQLKDAVVRAPVPTWTAPGDESTPTFAITQRAAAEGAYVKSGAEVFRLVIDRTLKLRAAVPEQEAADVRVGQKAEIHAATGPSPYDGTVSRINPAVDSTTRTIEVEIEVPNPLGALRPGGFAKTRILTRLEPDAPTVPREALLSFGGVTKVFLTDGRRVHETVVAVASQGEDWAAITEPPLPRGARVVTGGPSTLADGDAVFDAVGSTGLPPANLYITINTLQDHLQEGIRRTTARASQGDLAMILSDLCIRRPVFTWVLAAVPLVLGLVSYFQLGVDLFPKIDFPVVSVSANLPGVSAEEMETTVTRPIEEAVNTIAGVDELHSTIREGSTAVTVTFLLEKDGNVAAQEVRDKLSAILRRLPEGMEPPVVSKFDLDASPIVTVGVSGKRDVREVTEIARHQIQEVLQTVPGVGAVVLSGGRTRAINVVVDPDKLASCNLSVEDVRRALTAENVEAPGGVVRQGSRELVLRTLGRVSSVDQFNDLIVANRNNHPVRLRDVGRAEDSVEEPRGLTRLDGANAVSLFVQKQSGANTIQVSDAVQERLAEIAATLPHDLHTEIIQDQARFVRRSIEEVKFHLLLAGGLVSLTILLFIRDWRTTLIATLAIPTSIIPTFLFMHCMGFTLNNITMLGLILAIGIVIDDAVVVHENIFRRMEEDGLDAVSAARQGTKEIALAVMATSLSLVVIFLPVAFMGGIIGRFFSSFGMTVAFAVGMSLFTSLTLTPMLCAHFLRLDPSEHGRADRSPASFTGPWTRPTAGRCAGLCGIGSSWSACACWWSSRPARSATSWAPTGCLATTRASSGSASSRRKATPWSGPTKSSPRSKVGCGRCRA